jgi:hypothetical protein
MSPARLYDHDLQARPGPLRDVFLGAVINMGFWDPMSCHVYKREIPPPGISSWTKLRLGWADTKQVRVVKPTERTELLLGPLVDGSSEVLAIKIPLSATTYYLVENRQPAGFDRHLPGHGALCGREEPPESHASGEGSERLPHSRRAARPVGG